MASATLVERTVNEALDTLYVKSTISERAQSQIAVATETLRENIISGIRGKIKKADSMPA